MKRVQQKKRHKNSATQKKTYIKQVQQEKRAT